MLSVEKAKGEISTYMQVIKSGHADLFPARKCLKMNKPMLYMRLGKN